MQSFGAASVKDREPIECPYRKHFQCRLVRLQSGPFTCLPCRHFQQLIEPKWKSSWGMLSGDKMPELKQLIAKLKSHYGKPNLPPAKGPFELVMWENACYLLPDERRAAVFEGLRLQVGMNAGAIWQADKETLLGLARMGGIRPETRVFRWREIARITLTRFDDDV